MTTVTMTQTEIRAYNHSGKTGVCIAVSAVLQTAARVLNAGKALASVEMTEEPPLYVVTASAGDLPTEEDEPDRARRVLIASQRAGRRAFISAVFAGVLATLEEIARLNGAEAVLEVKDRRHLSLV